MDRIEFAHLGQGAAAPQTGADPYSGFLKLDPMAGERLGAALLARAPDAEALADDLFDQVLATEPLRELLADGRWDGRMPQFECGSLGRLLGGRPGRASGLSEAGHELRRSGLAPGWLLVAYGHYLGTLIDALSRASAGGAAGPPHDCRDLVQTVLVDAAQVLDAYFEAQAERAALAERQLFTMFEAMSAGILVLDENLQVLRANRAFSDLFGWGDTREVKRCAVEEATGIGELAPLIDGVLVSGRTVHDCLLFRQSGGGRRVYTCDIEPMADENGAAALVMLRDVTDAYQQREAAEELRAAVDLSHDAILLVDPRRMALVGVNETACRMLGYSRKEMLALGPQDLLPERSATELEAAYGQLREPILRGEMLTARLRRCDNSEFPAELAQKAVRVGERDLVVISARDLSERLATEARLRDSEAMYRETFEHTAVGIAHVAPDGSWLRVNDRLCEIVGYSREELLQKTFQDITHPDDLGADLGHVAAMLRGEISRYSMEKRYLRKDGATIWILLTVALVREEDGSPRHFISVVEDIDAKIRAQEENQSLLATLESRVEERTAALVAANQDLEAFSYSVTHDLRAPLRSISGFAQALEARYGASLDALGQGYLQKVGKAVNRMDRLIEDLLRLAQIGRAPLELAPVDLAAMASEILHRLAAAEPGRQLHWHIARVPLVRGDPGWIAIALENLLANAWKFTSEKALAHIRLSVEEQPGRPPVFVISDNGIGFAAEQAENLFQPFARMPDTEKYPGHGIGLAIVARIIQRHGGTILAVSNPGEGASFRFTLGAQASPEVCRE